ncbi:hypothetical protein PWT90_01234 [Aphanocladium album]|nr:hypothetical protein PWT90_01234 [Aphanocladium album]
MMSSIVSCLLLATCTFASTVLANTADFNWDLVTPSTSLNYTDCYQGHRCAKLLLPLDWLDPGNDAQVAVAIVALPAAIPETDPSFGGTIILNPGGPGGSGIDFLLFSGPLIQGMVDGNKKYEILSFDPRGVGRTTPSADCYHNEYARGNGAILDRAIGFLDGGEAVQRRRMSHAQGFAKLCAQADSKYDIRKFISTTSVARDMAKIVDEIRDLRHQQDPEESGDARLELRAENANPARINYWGWSYGTDLGNYFASMFPGRVDRMILEAVQDVRDYASGEWLKFGDSERTFDYFWETCYNAGDRCTLYQKTDSGPEDARTRFDKFLLEIDQNTPAFATPDGAFDLISKGDVMQVIFTALFQPTLMFAPLAITLSEAMAGNFSDMHAQLGQPDAESCPLPTPNAYTWIKDAQTGIACGDGEPQNMTFASYRDYIAGIAVDSPTFWPFLPIYECHV